ncbi:Large terminase phage packaging protein [Sphingomonas laterariae]|uniref:Large terminase phage packaging protein n=2 Tax=Edaphosphingomonas laterariae TaxID=861865 RepID=A0A239C922_9SPHN|nr:Large terminase phage packaging protein [Sphingomonas laterariae]
MKPAPLAELSQAERLAFQDDATRAMIWAGMTLEQKLSLVWSWDFWARPSQRAPAGTWRTWLIQAGRGFGKTRAGAEWVRREAERKGAKRIALVGATMAEARAVMVEGPSGLLAIAPPDKRPLWEPSLKRLRWPGGAVAQLYSAAEPESLRGGEHHIAWADEIAKWADGVAAWDNLTMGLRAGDRPRVVATTTPRPVALIRRLLAEDGTVVTRGRTTDNSAHLAADFIAAMTAAHGGTRIGRQELDGELIEEAAGALWRRELIEVRRVRTRPGLVRIVIGVDPPAGIGGDACGIVVVGEGVDEHGYVLADCSVEGAGPDGWARAVAAAAADHGADKVIAEANNGGAMVEAVLRAACAELPVRLVHASHGKAARAEPVAMLYEQGRVFHVGGFPALEDEMAGLIAGGGYQGPGRSPDRADALVWALTELMLRREARPSVRSL